MTPDHRRIVEIDVPADLDTTWDHLREPALVRRWYGWDGPDQDERVRAFVETARTGGVGEARVLSWRHGRGVHVTLTPHGPATLVVVIRPPAEAEFGESYDEVDEDWISAAHVLRFALDVHPGQERRTWSAHGLDAGDRRHRLLDRIGLHGVHGIPIGGHVATQRPDGTTVGGTLDFRTAYCVGLRLHGFAQSFLVVRQTPPRGAQHPNGEVDAVLHTYGMDDETMAQVTRRWGGWWR